MDDIAVRKKQSKKRCARRYYLKHTDYMKEYSRRYRETHHAQCNEASLRCWKESQALTKDAANYNQGWTPEEDAVVLAKEKPMIEIAYDLGRTFSAVSTRRYKLLHPEKFKKR